MRKEPQRFSCYSLKVSANSVCIWHHLESHSANSLVEDQTMKITLTSVLGLIAFLIFASLGASLGRAIFDEVFSSDSMSEKSTEETLAEGMKRAAEEINSRAPYMLDSETRLESATAGPGAQITYQHTLINYASEELDKSFLRENLRPAVVSGVCENREMQPSLRLGAKYRYSYQGNDEIAIYSLFIDAQTCEWR
jgi:hypothetical protein